MTGQDAARAPPQTRIGARPAHPTEEKEEPAQCQPVPQPPQARNRRHPLLMTNEEAVPLLATWIRELRYWIVNKQQERSPACPRP